MPIITPALALVLCAALAAGAHAAATATPTPCSCVPNTSYGTASDNLPGYNGSTVEVDSGDSPTEFVTSAYTQVYGSAPSPSWVTTAAAQFGNSWWRRVDTVNQLLNATGKNYAKTYSNPWPNEYQFTTAACKNVARDIGAIIMFFFSCPGGTNCLMDWANTHAYGMGGADPLYEINGSNGDLTSATDVGFWYRELLDARYAGLQFLLPNAYGPDLYQPGTGSSFTNNSIPNLATALADVAANYPGSDVRVGLMDDTTGWNKSYYAWPFNSTPNMSDTGTDGNSAAYWIYTYKWLPFFSQIPSQYWYTVNVNGTNRPLIYFYNGGTLGSANAAAVIAAAKSLFTAHFGVAPYVVVDSFFFADGAMSKNGANADNEFVWDTLHNGLTNNISVSTDSYGFTVYNAMTKWDPVARNAMAGNGGVMPTAPNLPVATAGNGDGIIKDDSYLIPALANTQSASLLTLATWNDLGEGTGLNRNYDYYFASTAPPAQSTPAWQPPNVFMDEIRASQGNGSCGTNLPTPTATPTPHGALVADFANNADNNVTYWNSGNVLEYHDANSTSTVPGAAGWAANSGTSWTTTGTPPGYSGTGGYAGCFSGTLAPNTDTPYPYCFLALELVPGGSISSSGTGGAWTTVAPYAANNGLSFDYEAGSTGVSYQVQLTTKEVANYAYYQYTFTPVDTAWHTLNVYFPGVNAPNVFSMPGGVTTPAFDATEVGAVMFQVIAKSTAENYDLCVDNVTFNAPVPTPYATPTHGPMVADFANNTANNVTYWNGGGVYQYIDAYGTTSNHTPWTASSGTSWTVTGAPPGLTGTGYAACWAGNLTVTVGTNYPYSFLSLELVPGGTISSSATGGAWTSVVPYCPNSGLQFMYQAAAAGVTYQVQLNTKEVSNYNYYQYTFTSVDTAWHTVDVYFPGVQAPNVFALPGAATTPAFDPAEVGAVLFQVITQPGKVVGYGLCVDNVTFGAPPPPTPTVTPTASGTPTVTPTPSPSATRTASPSPTRSASPTPSASPSPSASGSPSPAPSATQTLSATATQSPQGTPSSSPSPAGSPTPSRSATPSESPSPQSSPTLSASPSASPSPSPSRTATATPTGSPSASPSATPSGSPTPKVSPTATPSVTASFTQSPQVSATASPSASATFTASPTASPSASPSRTQTASPSSTPSGTASATPSASPSATASPTASATPSVSASATASPSASDTPSASPSATVSPTASATATASPSETASGTASATPTASPTETATLSLSPTPAESPTATDSPQPSPSASPTASPRPSSTSSATLSPSPSGTASPQPSQPATATFTAAPTATVLPSQTPPPTATQAPTATPRPSATAQPSATPRPTATQAPGGPKSTADPSPGGPPRPVQVVPVPNPVRGSLWTLQVNLLGPASSLKVKVYAKSMVAVQESRLAGAYVAGWNTVSFGLSQPLPIGLYYVTVEGQEGEAAGQAPGIARLVYLP